MAMGLGWTLPWTSVSATDAQELLPPQVAFQVDAVRGADGVGYITFTIAPGYALYRDKIRISSPDAALRFVNLPHGIIEHDENLGDR
jgi:thiol:disulfide interchange protein DsbD